ncbi:U3 small nucleolar RNA-associated protein 6 family protein [Acanthocheilonema viteae]
MSEFVEEDIEGLLPVFEVLKGVQLLSSTEIDAFVKRCQMFEYRLQKPRKDSLSFRGYTDYLESILKLIRMRRKRIKYRLKEDEIESKIKIKIANLRRQYCERFKGRLEAWLDLIEFLKSEKMYIRCSKTYFRALQIFPRNSSLRIQAARYEYSVEHRIECARCIMQEGIRLDPKEISLWTSFVHLELDYVKWLITRKSILTGKGYHIPCTEEKELEIAKEAQKSLEMKVGVKEKSKQDSILGLRIVQIIINQALECCVSEKSALLLNFWRTTRRYGLVANHLTEKLYDMLWSPKYKSEESWIARSETMDHDQYSLYNLFDKACEDIPTEKMHRHYLTLCQRHFLCYRDPDAKEKFREQLFWLISRGYGTNMDVKKFNKLAENFEEKEKVLNEAVKNNSENAFLWMMLLQCKIKFNPTDVETIRKLFNQATREVYDESHGLADMYKVAIDWAHQYSEDDVDDFFRRATFHTPPKVACEMRCIRLNYLASVYPGARNKLREEYFLFAKYPPNSIEVHRTFINHELKSEQTSVEFATQAFELMIVEFGEKRHECWIDYANFMLKYDPLTLQTIHRRAMASLAPDQIEPFLVAYSNLLQNAASNYIESDSDTGKDDDDIGLIEDDDNVGS